MHPGRRDVIGEPSGARQAPLCAADHDARRVGSGRSPYVNDDVLIRAITRLHRVCDAVAPACCVCFRNRSCSCHGNCAPKRDERGDERTATDQPSNRWNTHPYPLPSVVPELPHDSGPQMTAARRPYHSIEGCSRLVATPRQTLGISGRLYAPHVNRRRGFASCRTSGFSPCRRTIAKGVFTSLNRHKTAARPALLGETAKASFSTPFACA
jgi:hypothetical protein